MPSKPLALPSGDTRALECYANFLLEVGSLGLHNTLLLLCSWLTLGFSDTLLLLRS